MGKKKRAKEWPKIDPDLLKPVDPEQFGFAIQLGSAAGSYRMPMDSPSTRGVTIDEGGGKIRRLTFTDIPENRFFMAIRDHFGSDHLTFQRVSFRWFALQNLHRSPKMKEWTKPDPEDPKAILISEAVFRAAACCPFTGGLEFDEETFFKTVRKLAAEEK